MRDVAHIGFPKTASTWLQTDVFPTAAARRYAHGPLALEIYQHVCGADEADYCPELLPAFLASSPAALISYESFSGRLWDGSGERSRTVGRLMDALRDPGVIIVVREQRAMLASIYAQYVNEGGTETASRFLTGQARGSRFDLEQLRYDQVVETWVRLVGRDRVLVLPYELAVDDRPGFVNAIRVFMGDPALSDCGQRRNPSTTTLGLAVLRRWNRAFRASRFNQPRHPLPGANLLRRTVQARIRIGRPTGHLVRDVDVSMFADSNARLQQYVDTDLATLGYA